MSPVIHARYPQTFRHYFVNHIQNFFHCWQWPSTDLFTPLFKVWSRWVAWFKNLFTTNTHTDNSSIIHKMNNNYLYANWHCSTVLLNNLTIIQSEISGQQPVVKVRGARGWGARAPVPVWTPDVNENLVLSMLKSVLLCSKCVKFPPLRPLNLPAWPRPLSSLLNLVPWSLEPPFLT